jgi:hypothetical protein
LATTFSIGFFGDVSLPISERILGAQASILAVSFCVFVLVALVAERRLHETALMASGTRLQAALTELQLLYENAPIGLAFLTPDCRYRNFNRRSYRQVCAKYRPASCGTGRVDRPGDFEVRGADHGHRGQWPTPGREQRGARVDYLLASAEG